jgi:LytR cell envelope-related transcriptional attenuator
MDELKRQLDEEARRVQSDPEALEAVRRRAGRRRVTRQIGTGALALAIAGAGFGVAYSAFRGGPAGRPLVGPSGSISPTSELTIVTVVGPGELGGEASALGARLADAGHNVEWIEHCSDCPVPEFTILRYKQEAREEAESIRRDFLPGSESQVVTWPANRPQIEITLGADYRNLTRAAIQVRILDGSLLNGAADAALTILQGEGYEVVAVQDAGTVYDETFISCAPQHDAEADLIREALFPKADIRVELPDEQYDVTVHIGRDFYDDYAGLSP